MNNTIEYRRDIPSIIAQEDMYQVSNFWRVRNITYYKKKTLILKPECGQRTKWYETVKLKKNWIFTRRAVHRLVARAFLWLNFFNSNEFVCHKDDNRSNNRADNLFVWTAKDNAIDAWTKWRWRMSNQKLSPHQVLKIKQSLLKWTNMNYLAKKYWCSYHNIYSIKTGKSRSYI